MFIATLACPLTLFSRQHATQQLPVIGDFEQSPAQPTSECDSRIQYPCPAPLPPQLTPRRKAPPVTLHQAGPCGDSPLRLVQDNQRRALDFATGRRVFSCAAILPCLWLFDNLPRLFAPDLRQQVRAHNQTGFCRLPGPELAISDPLAKSARLEIRQRYKKETPCCNNRGAIRQCAGAADYFT